MLHGLGVPVGQDVCAEGEVEGTCAHAGQGDLGDGAGAGDRLTWLDFADGEFAFGCEVGQEGLPAPPASLRRLLAPRQAGGRQAQISSSPMSLGGIFGGRGCSVCLHLPALACTCAGTSAQVQVIQST
jgi:hypothetical protein